MRQFLVAMLVICGSLIALKTCAIAGAAETTPLDVAVERKRGTGIEKFVDEENGVVCYFFSGSFGHPSNRALSCVKVEK